MREPISMQDIQWLSNAALQLGKNYTGNFFYSGFLYGAIGFFIGLILVWIISRSGGLRRPNRFWRTLAKIHWVRIPLLLALT